MDIVKFTTELGTYKDKIEAIERRKKILKESELFIKTEFSKATDAEKEAIKAFDPSIVAPFESVEAFVDSLEVEIVEMVEEVAVEDET